MKYKHKAPPKAFSRPGQNTGYWDDHSHVTVFDPFKEDLVTLLVDPDNIFEYNPRKGKTAWGFVNGKHELILTTSPKWEKLGAWVYEDGGHHWHFTGKNTPSPAAKSRATQGIDRKPLPKSKARAKAKAKAKARPRR